ncbi:ciliary microtubule inner protein 7 isoform X2 [Notamacropus eugenii]
MTQSALVGSWYNSGFYGHYRGQFKCELAQEYRLAAKPQPPAVFLQRIKEPPRKHLFSKHDNRGVFDPGIGKRKAWEKLKKKCNVFNWPSDDEAQGPLVSSYQKDYYQKQSGGGMHGPIFQPLVHYIQSGAPQSLQLNRIPSTTYQHTFCHQLVSQMPDEKFKKEVSETREKLGISQLSESKEKLGISQLSESKEKLWISPCPAPSAFSETLPELPVTVNRKKVEPFLHFTVSDSLRWLDPLKKLG